MHFAFYLGDSGRIGLNLHFKSNVKSGRSVPIFSDSIGCLAEIGFATHDINLLLFLAQFCICQWLR